ncbi:MAG: PIN domain-containing protein [Kiritimatiellae bacterium]|nr:PIN domain-containing protein [Kiritimatiellia bacterium]
MQRVFLDANVLFSAAYREQAGLLRLWRLAGVELMTSDYAAQEAAANLIDPAQRNRLANLLKTMVLMLHTPGMPPLPAGVRLPEKDAPILQAALAAGAAILLTGDITHFGRYFGKTVGGVRILSPGDFLREREK